MNFARLVSLCCAVGFVGCVKPVTLPGPVTGDCSQATPLVPGVPGSPGHLIPSSLNPNGQSELAFRMRAFVQDWADVKLALAAKAPVTKKYLPSHRALRCSWPTDPADRTAEFDALAQAYLGAVDAFDRAPGDATYDAVLSGCAACHEVSCPGPLSVIEGLARGK